MVLQQMSGATAIRPLYCVAEPSALPVPLAKCGYDASDLAGLSKSCGTSGELSAIDSQLRHTVRLMSA